MKYVKKYSSLKYDATIAEEMELTAAKLEQVICALDLKKLALSSYGESYFRYDRGKITFILQGYVFILLTVAEKLGPRYKEIAIIDHGGGIGLFSFFCKMLGIKTVIYNDYNGVVREDAEKIAQAISLKIDHYSVGDVPAMLDHIRSNGLAPRILVSRNVLEHIYDIDHFLHLMSQVPGDLSLIMSTTANRKNPLVSIYTRRAHRKYELVGKPVSWGSSVTVPGSACVDVREKIIRDRFPGLKIDEYSQLAKNTRGLIVGDILKKTQAYLSTGKYPVVIPDPTNTCEPYSGNWVEQLVPIREYERMVKKNGFTFDFQCGFYSTRYHQKILNLITPVLNFMIYLLGKKGLFLAPFMMIVADKRSN
jgi:hypothetical protein